MLTVWSFESLDNGVINRRIWTPRGGHMQGLARDDPPAIINANAD